MLSRALAVPVAGDTHWHYCISRQCGLLDSVLVATVRTGTNAGQAWLVLPWQCWGDSEWSYASPQCHNKHLFPEVLLGGATPQTPALPVLILMDFGVFLSKSQLWEPLFEA